MYAGVLKSRDCCTGVSTLYMYVCSFLTSGIFEECQWFSTVWAILAVLLKLSDAVMTEDLPTLITGVSRMLVRVSGHTETDLTLELFRRVPYPWVVITFSLSLVSHGYCWRIKDGNFT